MPSTKLLFGVLGIPGSIPGSPMNFLLHVLKSPVFIVLCEGAYSKVVLRVIRIDEARVRFPIGPQRYSRNHENAVKIRDRAHSKVVLRVHGMDEDRVRFPVGPQSKNRLVG